MEKYLLITIITYLFQISCTYSTPYDIPESPEKVKGGYKICITYLSGVMFVVLDEGTKHKGRYSEYDYKGNIINDKLYDPDGPLLIKFINKYDDIGKIIEDVEFSPTVYFYPSIYINMIISEIRMRWNILSLRVLTNIKIQNIIF